MDQEQGMKQAMFTASDYARAATNHWMTFLHGDDWRQMPASEVAESLHKLAPLIAAHMAASASDFAAFLQHKGDKATWDLSSNVQDIGIAMNSNIVSDNF